MSVISSSWNSIGIIGAGISGVSLARLLKDQGLHSIVYERNSQPGGLIHCSLEDGNLFHRVGGHVFNSKNSQVLDWFWGYFDKEKEFIPAKRNAVIFLNGEFIGYPIEFNLNTLDLLTVSEIREELNILSLDDQLPLERSANFHDFLLLSFGKTLCSLYFFPYNTKIWKTDLSTIPLGWLDGKLPMTSPKQILNSMDKETKGDSMVHSSFFYPLRGGSQFIIDRLSDDIHIVQSEISSISVVDGAFVLNNSPNTRHNKLVYTGDIRELVTILPSEVLDYFDICDDEIQQLASLQSNSTSTMLCECDSNPYSWVYIPSNSTSIHRIIMTGNFSENNTSPTIQSGRTTCTIEHSGYLSRDQMASESAKLPFNMRPIAYNYCPNSYIVHAMSSKQLLNTIANKLSSKNFYCLGRFSEWEYFNMDAAIESAMRLADQLSK